MKNLVPIKKKRISFWYGCICFIIISLFTQSCNNEDSLTLSEETEIENDALNKITPINLNVKVKNGALLFESSKELRHAEDVLSKINLASRLAWEESIGFESLRSIYEKVLEDFYNEKPLDLAIRNYSSIIDFNTPMPTLKKHDLLVSSILSLEHTVYIGEAVGTLNKDGSFWALDGDIQKLNELLQNPIDETDLTTGTLVVLNKHHDSSNLEPRSCTSNANESYLSSQTINNGTGNGSTRLDAEFRFSPQIYPINSTFFEYVVDCYMLGRSFRRKTCGCGWKPYPDDHMFYWNVEIGQGFSGPITTYSGQETHFNNELAQKFIFAHSGIHASGASFNEEFFYLNKVEYDTRHTTDNLDLPGISYSCN